MSGSLSVVMAVQHGECELERLVSDMVEVAADLSGQFEILLLDGGQSEVAAELATEFERRWPQVRRYCLMAPLDDWAAFCAGVHVARGNLLLYRPLNSNLDAHQLPRLWSWIGEQDVVLGIARSDPRSAIHQVAAWFAPPPAKEPGLMLLRRGAALRLLDGIAATMGELLGELETTGARYQVVELESPATERRQRSIARMARPNFLNRRIASKRAGG